MASNLPTANAQSTYPIEQKSQFTSLIEVLTLGVIILFLTKRLKSWVPRLLSSLFIITTFGFVGFSSVAHYARIYPIVIAASLFCASAFLIVILEGNLRYLYRGAALL
jgi:hypothetical protein